MAHIGGSHVAMSANTIVQTILREKKIDIESWDSHSNQFSKWKTKMELLVYWYSKEANLTSLRHQIQGDNNLVKQECVSESGLEV